MIIPIDDKYRIKSDENCWAIQCYAGFDNKKNKPKWNGVKYLNTLPKALQALAEYQVRTLDTETLEDALLGIAQIQQKFDDLQIKIQGIKEAA